MKTIEILGIIASIFVVISFTFKQANTIRKINIIGALLFIIYGLLIKAFSVWFLNIILLIIHIINLKGEKNNEK